jgi:hypothetical protein
MQIIVIRRIGRVLKALKQSGESPAFVPTSAHSAGLLG